jgi:hypothetical protein
MSAGTQNSHSQWVPAIPLPYYLRAHRFRCDCRRTFWTMDGYQGHYALTHILRLGGAA